MKQITHHAIQLPKDEHGYRASARETRWPDGRIAFEANIADTDLLVWIEPQEVSLVVHCHAFWDSRSSCIRMEWADDEILLPVHDNPPTTLRDFTARVVQAHLDRLNGGTK